MDRNLLTDDSVGLLCRLRRVIDVDDDGRVFEQYMWSIYRTEAADGTSMMKMSILT